MQIRKCRIRLSTHQQKVVIFRLSSQVFEYCLFPESLHQIPVFHNAMTNRPLTHKHTLFTCTKINSDKILIKDSFHSLFVTFTV